MIDWYKGLNDELEFWDNWFKTKGAEWPDDYKFRLDKNSEIKEPLSRYIFSGSEKIIDCGCGPLTIVGKYWKGKKLNIKACDALALEYEKLFSKYDIDPIIYPFWSKMEELTEYYDDDTFDIVYAQNSVDHSDCPVISIGEMIKICKPKGFVILFHEVNEGENENYKGLHQWNFSERNGDFIIWNKISEINISKYFKSKARIDCKISNGYILTEIQKDEISQINSTL